MLTNIDRIRLYGAGIIVLIMILSIVFNISARRIGDDIRVLNETRSFANALETYKHDFWQYPESELINLQKSVVVLSENGLASGEKNYFDGLIKSHKPVTYESDGDTYTINFTLKKHWAEQGLAGKKCVVHEYYMLSCED